MHNPRLLVLLTEAFVLQVGQQLCGINAVFYYSTALFEGVLPSPLLGSTLVALVNTVATYAAVFFMDRVPHRILLLLSTGGMLVSIILLILTQLGFAHSALALISVMAYVSFFEIGIGSAFLFHSFLGSL